MSILTKAKSTVMRWLSAAGTWSLMLLSKAGFNYQREVGDGRGNSIVMACIRWYCRTFPEAPLQVVRLEADGTETVLQDHRMVALWERPNPYYSGELMWRALLADWLSPGNAYILKVRNAYGEPVQLWWAPQYLMKPVWPDDGSAYISHYEYRPNGMPIRYAVEDVIHFRNGLDPANTRMGLSPLASLFREIFTDDEAASFSASLLRNMGVPGVIISPDVDEPGALNPDDAKAIKADFAQKFGGEKRGSPMVLPSRTRVQVLTMNPQQMDLKTLRRVPEERVTAVLGIPAIVAGLGAGLDRSTFANYAEAREAAYESTIIPDQRLFAGELRSQLLDDYGDTRQLHVRFDTSHVRVLQEDQNKLWQRVDGAVRGGWMMVSRAKEIVGETPEPGDNVYLRSLSVLETGPDAPALLPEPNEPPPPDDDAPANGDQDDDAPRNIDDAKALKALTGITFKASASRPDRRMIVRLRREATVMSARMAGELDEAFQALADEVLANIAQASDPMKGRGADQVKDALPADDPIADWPRVLQVAIQDEMQLEGLIPDDLEARLLKGCWEHNMELAIETTVGTIEDRLGVPVSFNLQDLVARDLIRNHATRVNLVNVRGQTQKAIMQALFEGREAGDGAEALGRRIRGMVEGREMYPGVYQRAYDRAKERGWGDEAAERAGDRAARQYRSETIARTETKTAQNLSSIQAYRQSDVVESLKVYDGDDCGWTSHDDPDKANGKIVSFEEAAQYPLAHPRCVIGSSVVLAPNLTAAFSRWYEGEVIVLRTAADDLLTCTPNHPVLTVHGWIAAGLLQEGDYIIRSLDAQGVAALADPDNEHVPAPIEQVLHAARMTGKVTPRTMPVAPEDFHGDGGGSKVYVEWPYGELGDDVKPPLDEPFEQSLLERAVVTAARLATLRDCDAFLQGLDSATGRLVGRGDDGGDLLRGSALVEEAQGLGLGAGNTQSTEPTPDSGAGAAQTRGDCVTAQALIDVQAAQHGVTGALADTARGSQGQPLSAESTAESGLTDAQACDDLANRLAGLVAPVRVVNIERRDFRGHVYNLETEQGWFIADHIITHNCVRNFGPVVRSSI